MLIGTIIIETLMIGALIYVAGEQYFRAQDLSTKLSDMRTAYDWAQRTMADMRSEIDNLVERLAQQRIEHAEEVRRREHRTDQQQKNLLTQVQVMAERLAGLKVGNLADKPVVDGADVPFLPEDGPRPYSAGLFDFINRMETEDAKELVEDYIEIQRLQGRADEQILDQLRRGDYVDG